MPNACVKKLINPSRPSPYPTHIVPVPSFHICAFPPEGCTLCAFPHYVHSHIMRIPTSCAFPPVGCVHSHVMRIPTLCAFPHYAHSHIMRIPTLCAFPRYVHSHIMHIPTLCALPHVGCVHCLLHSARTSNSFQSLKVDHPTSLFCALPAPRCARHQVNSKPVDTG